MLLTGQLCLATYGGLTVERTREMSGIISVFDSKTGRTTPLLKFTTGYGEFSENGFTGNSEGTQTSKASFLRL
jgi:hypothetical protein